MGKIPEVDSLGFPEIFVFLRLYEVGDSSEFGVLDFGRIPGFRGLSMKRFRGLGDSFEIYGNF